MQLQRHLSYFEAKTMFAIDQNFNLTATFNVLLLNLTFDSFQMLSSLKKSQYAAVFCILKLPKKDEFNESP